MQLNNYEDRSKVGRHTAAGFQFEFWCASCSQRWKSPFKPYRRGQLTGLLQKFAYFISGGGRAISLSGALSDSGESSARRKALEEAIELAEPRYFQCRECHNPVCETCWDQPTGRCEKCRGEGRRYSPEPPEAADGRQAQPTENRAKADSAGSVCPNCQTSFGGGRFCAECGFDMASTHKSCPGCGSMCQRSTRFCAECGHGF